MSKTSFCPKCRLFGARTIDSRASSAMGSPSIRRRRSCIKCGHGYTTYEISSDLLAEMANDHAKVQTMGNLFGNIMSERKKKEAESGSGTKSS